MGTKVLFAAGGTGGHINPGIAVVESLAKKGVDDVLFVGVGRDAEKQVIADAGVPYEVLPFVPVAGKGVKGILKLLLSLPVALFRGISLIKRYNPDVVIGCGGYPSVMPVFCGWLCGKKVALLEQNVKIGHANKFLSRVAHKVFAVPGATGFARSQLVQFMPNPVRQRFSDVAEIASLPEGAPMTILVVGGSQGAKDLNSAVMAQAAFLKSNSIRLIHQTGKSDFERVKEFYLEQGCDEVEVREFLTDIWNEYAKADLVIARAGAMTVAEIAACGRPAIFVPLAAASGHQRDNVKALEDAGAAFVLKQDDQLIGALGRILDYLHASPSKLVEMGSEAKRFSTVDGKSSAEVISDWIISASTKI